MKAQKIIYIIVLSFVFSSGYAQQGKIKKAHKEYNKLAYVKTSEILLEIAENGYKSEDILQKLANSFYFNNEMKKAAKWYGELISIKENQDAEYYFRYAIALRSIGDYIASDKLMKKFHQMKPDDLRGQTFVSEVDYKVTIENLSRTDVKLKNLDINTPLSDFGTTEYNGKIVFASARGGGKKYHWNDQPFLDLYIAEKVSDTVFGNVSKLQGLVNTKFHESSVAYTPNDSLMFFTRNNYFQKKYRKGKDGINRLKLYRATKGKDGLWGNIHSVHFNSDEYSIAHPTISIDGKKLYFASDMPGTIGLSDIFVVNINIDGTLGTPINLGETINTEAHESFPFVNSRGDLYFSSDGFPGLGALDVFISKNLDTKLKTGEKTFHVQNVGMPVNSKADDFGFYENLETKEVFFSSNRDGGKGSDDIYTFTKTECIQTVKIFVKESSSNKTIGFSEVMIFDQNGKELLKETTGEDGAYQLKLKCDEEYLVRAGKDKYSSEEKRFTIPIKQQDLQIDLLLTVDDQEIEPCDDLAKVLDIPIIYFDFNKFNIRYDAKVELQKVLAVLNKYPTMHIDIRSHTDCRGNISYNEQLSDRRAKSTRQYLINEGISEDRLTAKGYGESRLVSDCECEPSSNSTCSEEEHEGNRRSEFIITSINNKKCKF